MSQQVNGGDDLVSVHPPSEKELRRPPPSDDLYFKSYAHLGIHQEMIRDRVRSESYRNAIALYAPQIRGKVILDVGCGTAILSIFAAQAGARKVYAVDASDIAVLAKEVVAANGYADVITVIHGKIEDVDLGEPVDVIVSEWMGYALLYETMLPSVIRARDRWLRPGGLMIPSHATLYIAPISVGERYDEGVEFWRDVYGIDMSSLIPRARQVSLEEPVVEPLSAENVLSRPAQVITFDCRTVSEADVSNVRVEFSTHSMMREELHGFALWFDVRFEAVGGVGETIVLSTAPEEEVTHWMQTLLLIDTPIPVQQDSEIKATLSMGKAKEFERFLDIELEYR